MATKIILTVDEELSTQDCDDLRYLFADALGEFASHRYPPEQYIEERYPSTNEGYNWLDRKQKLEQVQRRVVLARKLHNAALTHVVDPEPREPKRAYDAQRWLRETFGMDEAEARATYNQLEDKRVARKMREQGLVTS